MFDFIMICITISIMGFAIYVLCRLFKGFNAYKTTNINDILNAEIPMFFMKASEYRKKDTKLKNKEDCTFKTENELFYIIQGDNKIENNIGSIYRMEFWTYEEYTYVSIVMRSHIEYMFSIDDEATTFLFKLANKFDIKIEDNTCRGDED